MLLHELIYTAAGLVIKQFFAVCSAMDMLHARRTFFSQAGPSCPYKERPFWFWTKTRLWTSCLSSCNNRGNIAGCFKGSLRRADPNSRSMSSMKRMSASSCCSSKSETFRNVDLLLLPVHPGQSRVCVISLEALNATAAGYWTGNSLL